MSLFSNSIFYPVLKSIKNVARRLKPFLPQEFLDFYRQYRKDFPLVDRSEVVLYASSSVLPRYAPRVDIDQVLGRASAVKVSLIATVLNEGENARQWLQSLLQQTRPPDEVVITDGGSSDDTVAIIEEFARTSPLNVQLIKSPGTNIAGGRNIAIQAATHPVVACTDFGCVLDSDWLQNLVLPFEVDSSIEVSAGYYRIKEQTILDRLSAHFFIVDLDQLDPQSFLPSSRSLAMTKSFWEKAGGYPQWLTDAGEDTLFDFQAKAQQARWAFVPQAKVYWRAPKSLSKLSKTYYRYAVGDGEVGILSHHYWYKTVEVAQSAFRFGIFLLALILIPVLLKSWGLLVDLGIVSVFAYRFIVQNRRKSRHLGINFYPYTLVYDLLGAVQMLGYARGVLNRPEVRDRKIQHYRDRLDEVLDANLDRKGIIVYPATHDWGFMFQRPHQMARSFARKGYLYFFCTNNEKTDSVFGFKEVEANLFLSHVPMEVFSALERPIVYIGSAWHKSLLSLFDNPVVIYDHYDDLEVSGADPEDHRQLLEDAAVVLVTSQVLLDAVAEQRSQVLFAPNGVDYQWIQQDRPQQYDQNPPDWEAIKAKGNPVIGYSGALAQWFDYDLLSLLATEAVAMEFVLIGVDYDGSLHRSRVLELPNVHWLGMKPYDQLFKYVWRFDVGIIPFKINHITLATSPIKLFEYLACGLPVVTTALPECKKYKNILVAENYPQFARYLSVALSQKCDQRYLDFADKVARQNTWDARVNATLALLYDPVH